VEFEYGRNGERYQFLRWGQTAFNEFKVVPPGTGIVHQVNIETSRRGGHVRGTASPTRHAVVGTDSHTTMVNGPRRARLGRGRHRGRGPRCSASRFFR
jgi:aconitate hydratase